MFADGSSMVTHSSVKLQKKLPVAEIGGTKFRLLKIEKSDDQLLTARSKKVSNKTIIDLIGKGKN